METLTWTGSNDLPFWDNPQNWNPKQLPAPGDDVVIGVSVVFVVKPDSITINSLDLSGDLGLDGGSFSVTDGFTIEVGGGVEIDDPSAGSLDQGNTSPATVSIAGGLTNKGGLRIGGEDTPSVTIDTLNNEAGAEAGVRGDTAITTVNNAGTLAFEADDSGTTVSIKSLLNNTDICSLGSIDGLLSVSAVDNQTSGQLSIDGASGTGDVTVTSLTNAGITNGTTTGFLEVFGSFTVTGTTTTTNSGDLVIGHGPDTPTMTIDDALDNKASGYIDLNSGALKTTALSNEGVPGSSLPGGIMIDSDLEKAPSNNPTNGEVTVVGSFTNNGLVGIGNGTVSPDFTVGGTLDNQAAGAIDLDSGVLAVGTLLNEGLTTGQVLLGIGVDFNPNDTGSGELKVGGNFTNAGTFSVGNGAKTPTVEVSGAIDNHSGALININSGTVTANSLTNDEDAANQTDVGVGVDFGAGETGPGALTVDGVFDNSGDFGVGNGLNSPTITIGSLDNTGEFEFVSGDVTCVTLDNDGGDTKGIGVDVDEQPGSSVVASLTVTGVFTNGGSTAAEAGFLKVGNDEDAPDLVIGVLQNEATGDIDLDNGAVSITTLTNAGIATSAEDQFGVGVDADSNEKGDATLRITGTSADNVNSGTFVIGNGATAPTVTIDGDLDNQAGGAFDIDSGSLTVATLTNEAGAVGGPVGFGVDSRSTDTGSGQLTVSATFTNTGNVEIGSDGKATKVEILNLDNQSGVFVGGTGAIGITELNNSADFVLPTGGETTATIGEVTNSATIDFGSATTTVSGSVTNSGANAKITVDGGDLTIDGPLSGTGSIDLVNAATLDLLSTATDGTIQFAGGTGGSKIVQDTVNETLDTIAGFAPGDTIDLVVVPFKNDGVVELATNQGGSGETLEILADDGNVAATLTLQGNFNGLKPTLSSDGANGGTLISLTSLPLNVAKPGSVLVADISGQPYQAYEETFDQGTFEGTEFFFDNPPSGATYSSYAYQYSAGNAFIGSSFEYTDITGQTYTAADYNYDGGDALTSVDFTGVTTQPYSSFEYDYVAGVFSGYAFTYTSVPKGASYSSYKVDYDENSAFAGEQFFFTNVTGEPYTGEEIDYDKNSQLSRVVTTGVKGQAYSSLELDYAAGAYDGYKAFYAGIKGQSFTHEEVDVSAAGALEKVVYSGMTSTPYSSVENNYTKGAVADVIYGFTDVTGQTYYAYQVEDNANGVAQTEIFDFNSGAHLQLALTGGQTLTSLGSDKLTGSGATTFVLDSIYGADTITNFASGDTVSLPAQEFAQLSAAIHDGTYSGGNATLSFSDGDTLIFKNMTEQTLTNLIGSFTSHA